MNDSNRNQNFNRGSKQSDRSFMDKVINDVKSWFEDDDHDDDRDRDTRHQGRQRHASGGSYRSRDDEDFGRVPPGDDYNRNSGRNSGRAPQYDDEHQRDGGGYGRNRQHHSSGQHNQQDWSSDSANRQPRNSSANTSRDADHLDYSFGRSMQAQRRDSRSESDYSNDDSADYGQSQHRGKGPRGYKRSDSRIEEDVNDRLSDHDRIDASDIAVQVDDGEVTLSGTVESRRLKHLIENVVSSVSGVKDVNNGLKLQQNRDSNENNDSNKTTSKSTTSRSSASTTAS